MGEREPEVNDAASMLESLRGLRRQLLSLDEPERIRALGKQIDRQVRALPAERRRALLEEMRDALRQRASGGDGARARLLAEHAAEKERLLEALDREKARADALAAEVETLKKELERRSLAASGGVGFGPLREGLTRQSQGHEATADSIGLTGGDAGLYELIRELARFALDFEMVAINPLLMELEVGPLKSADTQMFHSFQRQVGDRFRACLELREDSLPQLKESLNKNAKFLLFLNYSYLEAIDKGSRALLDKIDPPGLLEGHKRMIGYDYDGAWQKLAGIHDELRTRPKRDLWDEFFQPAFRAKLSSYMDPAT